MRRAFTLLEVVAAMGLLVAVLFTVGVLLPQALSHMRNDGFEAMAVERAHKLLEDIRAMPAAKRIAGNYEGGPAQAGFPPSPYPFEQIALKADGNDVAMEYRYRVVLDVPSEGRAAGLQRAVVTVRWRDARGEERSWSIASYL